MLIFSNISNFATKYIMCHNNGNCFSFLLGSIFVWFDSVTLVEMALIVIVYVLVPVISLALLGILGVVLFRTKLIDLERSSIVGIPAISTSIDDTTSPTVLLQSVARRSPVQAFVDCYLDKKIFVGDIVVVIKPFYSSSTNVLQPGDFLRLTAVRNLNQQEQQNHNEHIEKDSPIHRHLVGTGIILNHYLEFGPINNTIRIIERTGDLTQNLERNFPIDVISLEMTLLGHENLIPHSAVEGHDELGE